MCDNDDVCGAQMQLLQQLRLLQHLKKQEELLVQHQQHHKQQQHHRRRLIEEKLDHNALHGSGDDRERQRESDRERQRESERAKVSQRESVQFGLHFIADNDKQHGHHYQQQQPPAQIDFDKTSGKEDRKGEDRGTREESRRGGEGGKEREFRRASRPAVLPSDSSLACRHHEQQEHSGLPCTSSSSLLCVRPVTRPQKDSETKSVSMESNDEGLGETREKKPELLVDRETLEKIDLVIQSARDYLREQVRSRVKLSM